MPIKWFSIGILAHLIYWHIIYMKTTGKKTLGERINALLTRMIRFVTYDIWRITENEVSGLKELYINIIKTIILAVRGFQSENLQTKASALTYSTLLSIVPLLAVLLGIAKGFGFQNTVRQELFDYFPGHEVELTKAFEFVESYLEQAQGGVIIGVGLILLFYTVVNLISSIEDTFNDITSVVSEVIRLSGLVPDFTGTDDGFQRFIHLPVHFAELIYQPVLFLYSTGRTDTEHNSLPHYDPGIHRTLYFITQYESTVCKRPRGWNPVRHRIPILPVYLHQRADLGEQIQRDLR